VARPAVERFKGRIAKNENGCWLWTGPLKHDRAFFVDDAGQEVAVHRWSYAHFIGPIPDKATIYQKCEFHSCVNPAHLIAVLSGSRKPSATCKYGHEYTKNNSITRTLTFASGERRVVRICRACRSIHRKGESAKRRDQKRAKELAKQTLN